MIIGPLVEPAPRPAPVDPLVRATALSAVGWLLLLGAVLAAVVWWSVLSPFGFHRLDTGAESHLVRLDRAGTYVLFEEWPGASEPGPPPALDLQIVGTRGRPLPIQPLVRAGTSSAPGAYRDPWHEGRAVAKFVVPRAGTYQLRVLPDAPGTFDAARSRPIPDDAGFAVGREVALTWWSTPWSLPLLVVAPAVAGLLAVWAGRARRRVVQLEVGTGPLPVAR